MNSDWEEKGKCELFNNHEDLSKKHHEFKNQLQEEYNKKLEGNKI